jgi:AcrR family transcriptional regulator
MRAHRGRRPVVTEHELAAVIAMRQQSQLSMREIAAEPGVSEATLYRHVAARRN